MVHLRAIVQYKICNIGAFGCTMTFCQLELWSLCSFLNREQINQIEIKVTK